jgi:hypothetical protein
MAFGQSPGPGASAKQVQELLALIKDAGHTDFRDARGPLGLTQRQAGGNFTRDEATAFIDRLQNEEFDAGGPDMRHIPAEQLAAELGRRGWTVIEP